MAILEQFAADLSLLLELVDAWENDLNAQSGATKVRRGQPSTSYAQAVDQGITSCMILPSPRIPPRKILTLAKVLRGKASA